MFFIGLQFVESDEVKPQTHSVSVLPSATGGALTLGSIFRLLIWMGGAGGGTGTWAGLLGAWAGLARRVGAAETGVVMTIPVRGAEPVLLHGCPLTMRTWWMGVAEGSEVDSLVANMTGLCRSWGAAIMGGGGAGAMGTLVGVASFGLTC